MPNENLIANEPRSTSFVLTTASRGPFALDFPVYQKADNADLEADFIVTVGGEPVGFEVSKANFVDGVALDCEVTLDVAATGSLLIRSRRAPRTSWNFQMGRPTSSSWWNSIFGGLLASIRDMFEWAGELRDDIDRMTPDPLNDGLVAIAGGQAVSIPYTGTAPDVTVITQYHAAGVTGTVDAIVLGFDAEHTPVPNNTMISWVSGGKNTVSNPTVSVNGVAVPLVDNGAPTSLKKGSTGTSGYVLQGLYTGSSVRVVNPFGGNGFVTAAMYDGDAATAIRAAFDADIPYLGGPNETAGLVIDPTAEAGALATAVGRGMIVDRALLWAQSCPGKRPDVIVADGFHDVDFHVVLVHGRVVLRASQAPQEIQITSISYAPITIAGITGPLYRATVGLASALPTRCTEGFPLGCLNVQGAAGSESAEAINGAHKLETVSPDRQTITFLMRAHGPVLGTVSAFNNTVTLGITPNRLGVPYGALNFGNTTYDGVAYDQEGAINAFESAHFRHKWMGFAYKAFPTTNDEHDLLFASTGAISGDGSILAGAGDKVIRLARNASYFQINGAIGGCCTADSLAQITFGCSGVFQRVSAGGASVDAFSTPATSSLVVDQSVVVSSLYGIRTTAQTSQAETSGSSRYRFCQTALLAVEGDIAMTDTVDIQFCDKWGDHTGKTGTLYGDPVRANNTNGENLIPGKPRYGGGWSPNKDWPISKSLARRTFTHNFNSIAAGGRERVSDNAWPDVTVGSTVFPGVKAGMHINIGIVNGTETPAGLVLEAFPDGNGFYTFEGINTSTAPINPVAITYWVQPEWTDEL